MGSIVVLILILIWLACFVLAIASIVALWVLFERAGQKGWLAVIPVVNTLALIRLAGKDWWWIILLFIPFVNIVAGILVLVDFYKNYGEREIVNLVLGVVFAIVYLPYIAFVKKSTYQPVSLPKFKLL